jgi:hypothetical protein
VVTAALLQHLHHSIDSLGEMDDLVQSWNFFPTRETCALPRTSLRAIATPYVLVAQLFSEHCGNSRFVARVPPQVRVILDRLVELREHDSKPIKAMPVNRAIG